MELEGEELGAAREKELEEAEDSEEDEEEEDDAEDEESAAAATGSGAPSSKGKRRRRSKVSHAQRWRLLVANEKEYSWVKTTEEAKALFDQQRKLHCLWCERRLKKVTEIDGKKFSNVSQHMKTQQHKDANPDRLVAPRGGPSILATLTGGATSFRPKHTDQSLTSLRSVLALSAGCYAPKSNLPEILGGKSNIFHAATLLNSRGFGLTSGTVAASTTQGMSKLLAEIASRIKGRPASIGVDEASHHSGGGGRPNVCVLSTASAVFAIDLIYIEPEENPDAVQPLKPSQIVANQLRGSLEAVGFDIATQATCLVGDGASFNDALAKELGIPRLFCGPHALALIFKALTSRFRFFSVLTSGLSACLGAGGGTNRKEAFRKAGLSPEHFHCVVTRWGQTHRVAQKLLEDGVFEKVRKIVSEDPSFQLPKQKRASAGKQGAAAAAAVAAAEAGEEDAEPEELVTVTPDMKRQPVTSVLRHLRDALEVSLPQPQRRNEGLAQLYIVSALAGDLTEIITRFSASAREIDIVEAVDSLNAWKRTLDDAAMDGNQSPYIQICLADKGLSDALVMSVRVSFM